MKKYHYTYLIIHKNQDFKYIGVRSCNAHPQYDTEYWGSSKHLPSDVKDTHSKIILKIFDTRKDALSHEIEMHEANNVVEDSTFYNKAKQKSLSFDTTGFRFNHTEEAKQKISNARKGELNPYYGKKHSKEIRDKMSQKGRGRKQTKEHIEKRIKKGKDVYNAKSANVYSFIDDSIIAENICISEWARENNHNKSLLLKTAKRDLAKPKDRKNVYSYKNMYVVYTNA